MNIQLHKYLEAVKTLTEIPKNSAVDFAERVMSDSIDSKIVKDFYGKDHSISKYREKYDDKVESISISSRGSMLLDFQLPEYDRKFPIVDLGDTRPLSEEYIEVLEDKEIKSNDSSLNEYDVSIDVIVEALDTTGRAKFTVMSIMNEDVTKPFKAQSVKLPKVKLDQLADYFKNGDTITIKGDIEKSKGKLGQILVDELNSNIATNNDNKISMFG